MVWGNIPKASRGTMQARERGGGGSRQQAAYNMANKAHSSEGWMGRAQEQRDTGREKGIAAYEDLVGAYESQATMAKDSIAANEASIRAGIAAAGAEGIGAISQRGGGSAAAMAGVGKMAGQAGIQSRMEGREKAAGYQVLAAQAKAEKEAEVRGMRTTEEEYGDAMAGGQAAFAEAIEAGVTSKWMMPDRAGTEGKMVQAIMAAAVVNKDAARDLLTEARSKGYDPQVNIG